MAQIRFKAHLVAPYFKEIPQEIKENWLNQCQKSAPKTYQGIKKAIKTRRDFRKKMALPTEKTIVSFTPPEFISRAGLTCAEIIQKAHKGLVRAEKGYRQAMKKAFKAGCYEEKVEFGLKRYSHQWCRFIGPLKGYKNGHILGLSTMVIMALTGSKGLVDYLKEQKVKVEDEPVNIVIPEKLQQFRRCLDGRLMHWGSEIITQDYDAQTINKANEKINQLVNEYIGKALSSSARTECLI
ncbi:MAG: hypothetical protein AB1599_09115 [Planctomycetota bacterium]